MAETRSRFEIYRSFLEFVAKDLQGERHSVNRRMLSVFFWCFILPAGVSASMLLLIKNGILPRSARGYLDWLALVFPVCYSIYFLSFEVLVKVPKAFRLGGAALSLGQALKDGAWRERVTIEMERSIVASADEWNWITSNFRVDLQNFQNRTRYLTALAGAVFFLLMQGIDSLSEAPSAFSVTKGFFGWVETGSSDFSQFVGLALFLLLLYLSGEQNHRALARYLSCAEFLNQHGSK